MIHLKRENFDVIVEAFENLYDAAKELLQNLHDADQVIDAEGNPYQDIMELQNAIDEAEKYFRGETEHD